MIPNLQDLVPEQPPAMTLKEQDNNWNFTDNSFWQSYHDFATLNDFTETMVQQYPDLVKRTSLGKTYEGREVFGLTIHGYKRKGDDDDDDDDDEDEEDEDAIEKIYDEVKDIATSWWKWFTGRSSKSSAFAKKPSKPKKHPKAIVIHGGQHARGNTDKSILHLIVFSFCFVRRQTLCL